MSRFLSKLEVEEISDTADSGRGIWRLMGPLVYQSDLTGDTFVVPAGTVTDFASVPRLPFAYWLCGGTANAPATLHDWAYTKGPNGRHPVPDRATADALFKEAALAEGVPAWRAWMLWFGVRIGGASHWD